MGHNTWTGYYSMLRLLKVGCSTPSRCLKTLGVRPAPWSGSQGGPERLLDSTHAVSGALFLQPPVFSSGAQLLDSGYYGQLYSGDDFYSLSSGLTVQETTNSLYKKSTAELIQPLCVLTWARTILANRLAIDGPSWVKWFEPFNSGTINNQWTLGVRLEGWLRALMFYHMLYYIIFYYYIISYMM